MFKNKIIPKSARITETEMCKSSYVASKKLNEVSQRGEWRQKEVMANGEINSSNSSQVD